MQQEYHGAYQREAEEGVFVLEWELVIIGPDSILRKIPVALDRKQAYFFEGIRISAEMIDLAHVRLQQTLLEITKAMKASASPRQELYTSAMLDAWSIIDSVHRLQDLAHYFPAIKHREHNPGFHNLLSHSDVNKLRNTVQHLPGSIREMEVAPQWSVWGVLNWCVPYPDDVVHSCSYMCGHQRPGTKPPMINPAGRRISLPVGLITIVQDQVSVCISDLIEDVIRFANTMAQILQDGINGDGRLKERYAADVLVVTQMKFV